MSLQSRNYPPMSPKSSGSQSRSHSMASSTSSRLTAPATAADMNLARAHYDELKAQLASYLAKEAAVGVSQQRANAREKLVKLNRQQFHELATDVFDELMRRNTDDKQVPHLPERDEFHPKRNQARQKLATLPKSRFKDLSSDVFFELDRRYPEFREPRQPDFVRPPMPPLPDSIPSSSGNKSKPTSPTNESGHMAQPSQATNIVPVIGKMNFQAVELDYKVQTGIHSSPPPPYRTDDNSDVKDFGHDSGPSSSIPRNGSPSSDRREPSGTSVANTSSSSNGSTHQLRDTLSRKSVPTLPNNSPAGDAMNYQSLDGLMAAGFKKSESGNNRSIDDRERQRDEERERDWDRDRERDKERDRDRDNRERDRDRDRNRDRDRDRIGRDRESTVGYKHVETPTSPRFNREFVDIEVEKVKAEVKSEYEHRIAGLRKQIEELQDELLVKSERKTDTVRVEQLEDDLTDQKQVNKDTLARLDVLQDDYTKLEDDYRKLEDDYRKLDDDYHNQQEVANDVREEATSLLVELKELTRRNDELMLEKEQAQDQINKLVQESKEWQTKFEKTRTDLRNLKATSSFVREPPKMDMLNDNLLRPTPNGAIEQGHVIAYQASVDDLLRAGRSDTPANVLMAMKSIVLASKTISEDVEYFEARPPPDFPVASRSKLHSIKAKFSSTLPQLMTAAKNHATGMGISPVSLLDAAAGHLTATVVELIQFLGMTGKSRNDDDDTKSTRSEYRRKDSAASVKTREQSPIAPPSLSYGGAWSGKEFGGGKDDFGNGKLDRPDNLEANELKAYLERNTDSIVQAIQTLLTALRSPSLSGDISPTVTTITDVISNVVFVSRKTFARPSGLPYSSRGDEVLRDLESSKERLIELQANSFTDNVGSNDTAKRKLTKESYEIARFTKELVGLFD